MPVAPEELQPYDLVGTVEDADLKAIVRLAAQVCGVPTATVNLLDEVSQHNVATVGFERASVPVEASFCHVTIRQAEPVHVPDARQDARFAKNPHVTGELGQIVFYAGSQLRRADGAAVGTLCVFDDVEHVLDAGQRAALDDLAAQAVQVLAMRAESRRLSADNAELHRSNADLAAFTGRIAHDLRNPIGATRGFLQLALSRFGEELTGKARECVGHAEAATARMAELVDDLLQFAAAGASARREQVDVGAVAAAVVQDVAPLLESTQGRVELGALPVVQTDPTLLRQLLQNVVCNGLKYSRAGVAPVVSVTGEAHGAGWSVSVADNGRGIPAADRGAVFELFSRLPEGRDVGGSGIGLATCARIADALGATITLSDTPGGGTTLTLQAGDAAPTPN